MEGVFVTSRESWGGMRRGCEGCFRFLVEEGGVARDIRDSVGRGLLERMG